MARQVLGKEFGSLLPENYDSSVLLSKDERVQKILIADIKPDPNQPRKTFDPETLNELTKSIKRYGILQPLVITSDKKGGYTIIAGERRFRAAKKANLTHLPALVRTLEDLEKLEIGLIENVQREDLTPIEQALSIARLNEQFSISFQEIAERLGKAHTTIVNNVRLLQLPEYAREAIQSGKISEGHGRAILAIKDTVKQKVLYQQIINRGWSVRQAENFAKNIREARTNNSEKVQVTKDELARFKKDQESINKKLSAKTKVIKQKSGIRVTLNFKSNKDYTQFVDKI